MKGRIFTAVVLALVLILVLHSTPVWAEDEPWENPYLVRTFVDDEGRQIDEVIVPGRPPEIKAEAVAVPEPRIARGINNLGNVPAFDWSHGCSATSGAMLAGYYDRIGYSNMYAGPTNGGVMPLNNSYWGSGECPLSATHQGKDGLVEKGHVDDYYYFYLSENDPYYGNWAEHGYANCTADFMGTNQWYNWQNKDGSTTFYYYTNGAPTYDFTEEEVNNKRDGCHGIRLFVESRDYNVYHDGSNYQNYNQYIYGYGGNTQGFTFYQFKAEIDAGRPVFIHVEGHTMLGYGYDDSSNLVYLHDTWDYNDHTMTWGGTYGVQNLQHYGVTVIQLQSVITSCNSGGTEKNQFVPNESVYVKGSGLEPGTEYKIWIQNNPVSEGDSLVVGENPATAETPKNVTSYASGSFGPTLIWAIPADAQVTHDEYDIVVNKGTGEVGETYNAADDGLDSASVAGIVAPVPELPTILLFSMGLLALAGYVLVSRKNRER